MSIMFLVNLQRGFMLSLILIGFRLQALPCLSTYLPTETQAQQATFVNFCDLYETPEKYEGKLIRTKAILVAIIEPVIHGDSSFLISPACKELQVMCTYGYSEPPTSKMGKKLKKLFFNSKKGAQGRAEVVLQGTFEIAKQGGFDEFSTIRYRIDLAQIESAQKSK